MLQVIKSGFNPGYGLFTTTGGGQYFPGSQAGPSCLGLPPPSLVQERGHFPCAAADPFAWMYQAVHMDHGLGLLNFLGLMLGKAMYEGMLMDLPLAPFFILRLQVPRSQKAVGSPVTRLAPFDAWLVRRSLFRTVPFLVAEGHAGLAAVHKRADTRLPSRAAGRCLTSCSCWTRISTAPLSP